MRFASTSHSDRRHLGSSRHDERAAAPAERSELNLWNAGDRLRNDVESSFVETPEGKVALVTGAASGLEGVSPAA